MAEKVDGDLEMAIATAQTLSEDNVQGHVLLSYKANKRKKYIGRESVLLTNDICSSSSCNVTLLWLQRVSLIT